MYGVNSSTDAISRDINSLLYSSTFKHPADAQFANTKHLISLNPYPNYNSHHQNHTYEDNQNQNQSSLSRYRSTPTSFFSNLLNENVGDELSLQQQKDLPRSSPVKVDDSRRVPDSSSLNNSSSYGYTNQSNLDSTSTNLIRQNSTPAGVMNTVENGYASMKKGSSSSTLKNHVNFSLGPSSSPSRFIPQIAQNKNELQDSTFSSLKRSRDGVLKMPQNGETGNHTPNLVHHMSLPKTSSKKAVVEKFLQFQQESTVPWRTRAKRGCATHPRSIAERVRRTRISERIKRLQELFPDMDKQSTTSDMLDMAVQHIKNLQKELQTLNDAKARCKCSS